MYLSSFNLLSLNGLNGFVINGLNAYDDLGVSVSSAGDINGDGIDDIIVGADRVDPNGRSNAGVSYVIFGSLTVGSSGSINLSALNGSNGFVINGINAGDFIGHSVSNIGDINGDGFDDILIGAYGADPAGRSSAGQSYVIFGGTSVGTGGSLNLSSLNGSNGFIINGIATNDFAGFSVSNAGDINGDGFDDIIIGAFGTDPSGRTSAGQTYVVFGGLTVGTGGTLNLSSLNGSNGFRINGVSAFDYSGFSVSSAGDVNNDGIDDLIIGAFGTNSGGKTDAGASYVIFGSSTVGTGGTLNLSSLNGTNGFVINGVNANDFSGESVSHAGDINGDGIDDLIVGANRASVNGNNKAGASYVIFGGSSLGTGGSFNLSSLNGSNGFAINGINAYDYSGTSVSSAGDINGDGFDDLIIGAYRASANGNLYAGVSYLIFGSSTVGTGGSLNLSSLNGSNGFAINGVNAYDRLGSVSSAGDINGDGLDDIIIGAYSASPNGNVYAGASYVLFGNRAPDARNDSATTNEDTAINIRVLSNDVDPDGDPLALSLTTSPRNGTVTLNNNGTPTNLRDDFFRYTPNANFNGTDSFTYTVSDGSTGFDTATVNITVTAVNDAPVARNNSATTNEDTAVNIAVLGNDSDVEGDTLSISSFTNPSNGTVTLNNNGTSGNTNDDFLVYTPNLNYNGSDSFTYTISDGKGGTSTATVNLTVNSINDSPVADNNRVLTFGNTQITTSVATLLANDSDVDGDPLTITGVSNSLNGSATINNNGTSDTSDDSVVFVPNTGFSGDASYEYTVSDGKGGVAIALVTVAVGKILNGSTGNDTLIGGNSRDRLRGNEGNDLLQGLEADDSLEGNAGNDVLEGGSGNDTSNGGLGNDTLTGSQGNDRLTGGGNNDRFIYNSGDGTDTITDFTGYGTGSPPTAEIDTLRFIGSRLTARNLVMTQVGLNLEITFEGFQNTKVILQNVALQDIESTGTGIGNIIFDGQTTVTDSFDVVNSDFSGTSIANRVAFLNDLDNTLNGSSTLADVINGQGGNDTLNGQGGDDLLRGGTGNDSLNGGSGNDDLVGNSGNDTLTGGTGLDRFIYNTDANFSATALGIDTITDFTVGSDKIVLDKTTFNALSSIAGNGFSVASEFGIVTTDTAAATSSALIVYNSSNGNLFYNSNLTTSGFGTGAQFAILSNNPLLSASDFIIEA